jgi:integrase
VGVSYKEAVTIYKQKLATAAARRGTESHRMTFRTLADAYIETHCPQMSQGASERVKFAIAKNVLPYFGGRLVTSLKPIDVEQYRQKRLGDKAKPGTVNREWAIVKAILNKGEAWGLIERNPIRRGSVPMLPMENERLIFFERKEWDGFISAFENETAWRRYVGQLRTLGPVKLGLAAPDARRYGGGRRPDSDATAEYRERLRATVPVFKALLYTGSRLGEIVGLTWADVDFERGVLSISQEKVRRRKTMPISEGLKTLLLSLRRGVGAAPVFTRPDGSPFPIREVQRAFSVAKRLSGARKELTPHSIRHTFASWLAIAGTPLRTIQELLGHADIRMTIRYAHLSPAHLRDAVELVGSAENSNGLRVGCAQEENAAAQNGSNSLEGKWRPQRDSNQCRGLESKDEDASGPLTPIRPDSSR